MSTAKVQTSVIGSYPIHPDTMELMHGYFHQTETSWNSCIDTAVQDMIAAGIDLVSDGQTKDPFVQLFTRKLKGCRVRDRTEIIDKVEYREPITLSDQQYVKQMLPKKKGLIGVITGPYTLTKSCVDRFYHDEQQLAFDFATALRQEAELLQQHVDLISIDEPFFSRELPPYAQEVTDRVVHDLSCPTRLHVCGDVSSIVPELLEMPVDILSHEFKASPKLFDAFAQYDISKKMCLGAVRSDNARIESVEEIVAHILHGQKIFGDAIVQLAPDCGQRMLPREVAFQKLHYLVKAGEKIYGR
ncbi:MAG: hypothetical protein JW771_01960 [Candidatus Thermoplasmatota archaeon]|nr:hypothetical protein [Candidatus Thermoplasmatota archaeon]